MWQHSAAIQPCCVWARCGVCLCVWDSFLDLPSRHRRSHLLGLRGQPSRAEPSRPCCSGLPPDHSTSALITKTSILVWSCSHSVRTLMRNMWSCPDTQSEETQSFTPSVSPPFPSPFPPFSHSFCLAHTLSLAPLSAAFCPLVFERLKTTRHHFAASSSSKCLCQMPFASILTLFSLCLHLQLFFYTPPPRLPPTHISVTNDPLSAWGEKNIPA